MEKFLSDINPQHLIARAEPPRRLGGMDPGLGALSILAGARPVAGNPWPALGYKDRLNVSELGEIVEAQTHSRDSMRFDGFIIFFRWFRIIRK